MAPRTHRRIALVVLAWTFVAGAVPARAAASPEIGWHRIRPGDTLEGLAANFLGDSKRWPELHVLNPRILDPHWIFPGRKVRIPLVRPATLPNAQVVVVEKRVEARPTPVEWSEAGAGDLLLVRDGLRTHEGASARLRFDDGTTATVGEASLVFIRRQSLATVPTPRKEIEMAAGQAEFETVRGAAVDRLDAGNRTSHRLPAGLHRALHWRVTARSPSGLDGYPSPTRAVRPRLLVVFE